MCIFFVKKETRTEPKREGEREREGGREKEGRERERERERERTKAVLGKSLGSETKATHCSTLHSSTEQPYCGVSEEVRSRHWSFQAVWKTQFHGAFCLLFL